MLFCDFDMLDVVVICYPYLIIVFYLIFSSNLTYLLNLLTLFGFKIEDFLVLDDVLYNYLDFLVDVLFVDD